MLNQDECMVFNSFVIIDLFNHFVLNNIVLFLKLFPNWLKARSHCSDNENDNDNNTKRTHSIG